MMRPLGMEVLVARPILFLTVGLPGTAQVALSTVERLQDIPAGDHAFPATAQTCSADSAALKARDTRQRHRAGQQHR